MMSALAVKRSTPDGVPFAVGFLLEKNARCGTGQQLAKVPVQLITMTLECLRRKSPSRVVNMRCPRHPFPGTPVTLRSGVDLPERIMFPCLSATRN
jgi:hypothetical protein